MPRSTRTDIADGVYHVINRANAKVQIFRKPKDYYAFETLLEEGKDMVDMRILAYCVMPNHWHLVLQPKYDGDMAQYMKWITATHTQRWHGFNNTVGFGHLYQGRYKSFPVQTDKYFLNLCRYVEQNPFRARLVRKPDEWRWSSVWIRQNGNQKQKKFLSEWPVDMPVDYTYWLNEPQNKDDLEEIRTSVQRGRPYGGEKWTREIVEKLGLTSTMRNRGRPRKV
jgi:putative transposase